MRLAAELIELDLSDGMLDLAQVASRLREEEAKGRSVLRWGAVALRRGKAVIELGILEGAGPRVLPQVAAGPSEARGTHVALVVPTGVGAAVGGFIGDAGPVARVFEAIADRTLVHPNVVNGGDFYGATSRSWYVDGLTLDGFFEQRTRLARCREAKIGLIIDRLDARETDQIVNAANAMRAVRGIPLIGYVSTVEKVAVTVQRSIHGHFLGRVENPEVLFDAADALIARGANALAAVTAIGGVKVEDLTSHYFENGPNPVGSVEALMSRALTARTGLPVAHAPAFVGGLGERADVVDPRVAAEITSGTGLPCVLEGLMYAARPVESGGLAARDLAAIVVPFACAGGAPAAAALREDVPLVAVSDNHCAVGVPADRIRGLKPVIVSTYSEAVAFVACKRAGVDWATIRRPLQPLALLNPSK